MSVGGVYGWVEIGMKDKQVTVSMSVVSVPTQHKLREANTEMIGAK